MQGVASLAEEDPFLFLFHTQTRRSLPSKQRIEMAGEYQVESQTNGSSGKSTGRQKLEKWLNKSMKIKMSDGRTLIGVFLCTDRDGNIILGSCEEYIHAPENDKEDPRVLGLAMIPGHHVQSIQVDQPPS